MTGKWHLGEDRGDRAARAWLSALVRLAGWRRAPGRLGLARPAAGELSRWRRARHGGRRLLHDALLYRAHARVHRAGSRRGQAVLRLPGLHGAALAAAGAGRIDRAVQGQLRRRLRGALPAALRARSARPRGGGRRADRRCALPPRWSELDAERQAIEARRMEIYAAMVSDLDTLRRQGHRLPEAHRPVRQHVHHVHVGQWRRVEPARPAAADSATTSARNTTTASRTWARGTSYVMYGANWASVSASPFNRHKATASKGGVHVPAFVHYPKLVARGTRSDRIGTVWICCRPSLRWPARAPRHGRSAAAGAAGAGHVAAAAAAGQVGGRACAGRVFGWELFGHRTVRQGDWKIVWDAPRRPRSGAGSCSTSRRIASNSTTCPQPPSGRRDAVASGSATTRRSESSTDARGMLRRAC